MEPAAPISSVPAFGEKASSSSDYEQREISRKGPTEIPPDRQATLLILHMDPTARQICTFSGADVLMAGGDVIMVIQALRDYFRPDAVDRVFTQMEKFHSNARTTQPIEKFLIGFGILRRKAEKHMYPAGGGFPDIFICFMCIKAAQLKPAEKTLL